MLADKTGFPGDTHSTHFVYLTISALRWLALPCVLALSLACTRKQPEPDRSSLVERVASTGFIQLEADSFTQLKPHQQALAYWLTQAAIAIDPIIYDQTSRFGLRQKRLLEAIMAHPERIRPEVMGKIANFTKLFWANRGNHNDTTAQKFLPEFSFEELKEAASQLIRGGIKIGDPYGSGKEIQIQADLDAELTDLHQSLFDPNFEALMTAKAPGGGLDILQASANNFYHGVSMADLGRIRERYPLNSRLVKMPGGKLVEEVYRAGTPDGKVQPGLYARFLKRANECLQKAIAYADPAQQTVIQDLIHFYQTGEFQDWLKFGAEWVQNNPTVDFASGFIEVYRDARGAKGTAQSFVSITDQRVNSLMVKIADDSTYFEEHAPWDKKFRKDRGKPPLAKAVETVVETADFHVTTIGDNLPNENQIHEKYGTKSFLFTGSTRAFARATGHKSAQEFASTQAEADRAVKFGDEAEDLHTAMHEIIGHGSGKLDPKLTRGAEAYLKEYFSTLEEARADLMALWYAFDPKLKYLGLISDPEVAKAMYDSSARAALTQLRSIPKGNTIEEDHQRNRQLIVNYIMDKTGAIVREDLHGKTYLTVRDYDKMHDGVRMLLAELMRIKGEGDYNAIKALVNKYAVHFDPGLRDQVVARYSKLDLPVYWAGINADLTPHFGRNGEVTSVEISYPRDFVKQQLAFAAMYGKP
jgi:dipeptidyl-peptidase III